MAYAGGYGGGYADATGDVITSLLIETEPDDWYDASAGLISGSIRRGRQQELDQYQAGVCELLLDNDTRTFDPTYAASPLDGYVKPMRRVKLVASYNGITYPLFLGYADRWVQNREGPHRGTVSLTATDGFKVLSRARLASGAYATEVLADGPVAWWRFDEEGGAVAYDAVGNFDLAAVGSPELGGPSLIARDPGASVTFPNTNDTGFEATAASPVSGGPLSVEIVFRIDGGVINANLFSLVTSSGEGIQLWSMFGGYLQVTTGTGGDEVISDDAIWDGDQHHVVGVWDDAGDIRIYVDGVDQSDAAANVPLFTFAGENATIAVGQSTIGDLVDLGIIGYTGAADEVALYDYALSPARIVVHAAQVATPWNGDTPEERIDRVLDAVGWPAALRDLDPGSITLQSAELNQSALEHVQKVAESEFGNVYVTAEGILRFEQRTSLINQPTEASFSDAAGSDLPITFSAPEISEDLIRNEVTISRSEGVVYTARDDASIAEYGPISYVRDGLFYDDDDLSRYAAQFLTAEYGQPVERVNTMTVNPYRDPVTLWPAILGLELTDRVELEETPQNVTPAVARVLVVEGITHTFGPKMWEASFDLSPAFAEGSCFLELDTGECGLDEGRIYF